MSEAEVANTTAAAAVTTARRPKPAGPAGIASPCLIVYPVPSIADESFLHTIFKHRVGRSLFGGFGKGRFAIVELTDKAMLTRMVALLKQRDGLVKLLSAGVEHEEQGQENPQQQLGTADASGLTPTAAPVQPAEEKVDSWLDTMKADDMTFADLFRNPNDGEKKNAEKRVPPGGRDAEKEEGVFDADSNSIDHLLNMSWKGLYPVFVSISPVTVEEMYSCGGVVPEKKKEAGKKPQQPNGDGHKQSSEAATVAATMEEEVSVAATTPATTTTTNAAATVARAYPKDCCQKCGSPDHFTRNCDGSGVSSSAAPAETTAPASSTTTTTTAKRSREDLHRSAASASPPTAGPAHSSSTTPTATAARIEATGTPRKLFPKDCCQKCGSRAHFTRHCDGSGAGEATGDSHPTPPARAAPAAASPEDRAAAPSAVPGPAAKRPRKAEEPVATEATLAPEAPARPSFIRTSKDQCKHCGAESHLSRHCPNK